MRVSICRLCALFFLWSFSLANAHAQEASITLAAQPLALDVGGIMQVRIEARGARSDDIQLPSFDGFEVVSRQVHSTVQFQFGFGSSKQVQPSIVYNLKLRALDVGDFELGPARISQGKASVESQVLRISVGPDARGNTRKRAHPQASVPTALESDPQASDPVAFMRTVVTPEHPYIGQQITVSVYLYSRQSIMDHGVHADKPEMNGFWVHELDPQQRPMRTQVNGRMYRIYEVLRFAAFPLKSGTLEVGSAKTSIVSGGLGFFEPTKQIERRSPVVEIEVKPLPKPALAVPVVGQFEVETSADRLQLRTGDAATFTVLVSGSGNIRNLNFQLEKTPGLRILQPTIEDHIESDGNLVIGTRKVQWLVVGEQAGRYPLKLVPLRYFDPAKDAYQILSPEPLELEVAGEALASPTQVSPQPLTTTADDTEPKFGPLRLRSQLKRPQKTLVDHALFPWLIALPWCVLIFGVLGVSLRKKGSANRQTKAARRKRGKQLHAAREFAQRGDSRAFYSEASRVLAMSLSEEFGIATSGLTHEELRKALETRGLDPDLSKRILDELEGHDFARFSSSAATLEEMEACAQRIEVLMGRIASFKSEVPA